MAYLSQGRIRTGEQTEEIIGITDVRVLLAKNIKRYREVLGISQKALAQKVGCSPTLIGNIEINRRFPSAENINRIANALGVKAADLFFDSEPQPMKAMASKQELKAKLERIIGKAIDEHFK